MLSEGVGARVRFRNGLSSFGFKNTNQYFHRLRAAKRLSRDLKLTIYVTGILVHRFFALVKGEILRG
jgi:hypothetical protein